MIELIIAALLCCGLAAAILLFIEHKENVRMFEKHCRLESDFVALHGRCIENANEANHWRRAYEVLRISSSARAAARGRGMEG